MGLGSQPVILRSQLVISARFLVPACHFRAVSGLSLSFRRGFGTQPVVSARFRVSACHFGVRAGYFVVSACPRRPPPGLADLCQPLPTVDSPRSPMAERCIRTFCPRSEKLGQVGLATPRRPPPRVSECMQNACSSIIAGQSSWTQKASSWGLRCRADRRQGLPIPQGSFAGRRLPKSIELVF